MFLRAKNILKKKNPFEVLRFKGKKNDIII